jgi:hypothetical protein
MGAHPQLGEKIRVIATFGPDMIQAELADGRVRFLPLGWTSLSPPTVSEIDGKPIRFALESLQLLASWVGSRLAESATKRQKLDHFNKCPQKVDPDGTSRTPAAGIAERGNRGGARADDTANRKATAAVVEQARSSRGRSRVGDRRRARRK